MKDIIEFRRIFHQCPELGMKEYETKKFILSVANKLDCLIEEIGRTGLLLFFDNGCKKTIGFRAEMDALPIKEENEISYISKNEGLMHACGHDGHMAILLGYAKYLSENKSKLKNNIVCLFQPSEETNGGSKLIVDSKILDKYQLSALYALHLWPGLTEGDIYSKSGGLLAMASEINLEFYGHAVHAANKDEGVDSLNLAMQFIDEINSFNVSDTLIHFGRFNAGVRRNIVADYALAEGTIRSFRIGKYLLIKKKINALILKYKKRYQLRIKIKYVEDFPAVYNNFDLCKKLEKDHLFKKLKTGYYQAEDFGVYREIPYVYFLLGIKSSKLHSSNFNFNEDVLSKGFDLFKTLGNLEY